LEVALCARGVDEERQRRRGEPGRREVAELAREDDRGRVVPLGLRQDVSAEARSLGRRALALEGLGAEGQEAAPLPRRHGGPRGDQLLKRGRIELRLERVEGGAESAPSDRTLLSLEEREEEVERADAVALREAQPPRGEARGHVEEIAGRDEALE